jgi:hypothetical protein
MKKHEKEFVAAVRAAAESYVAHLDRESLVASVLSAADELASCVPIAGAVEGKPKIGYGGTKGMAVLVALAEHTDWKVAQVAEAAGCSGARVNEVIRFLEWEGNTAAEALAKFAEPKPAVPVTEAPPVAEPAPKEPHKSKPLNIVMEPAAGEHHDVAEYMAMSRGELMKLARLADIADRSKLSKEALAAALAAAAAA